METRDYLQRALLNTQEAVRDFEMYSKRIQEGEVSQVFKQFAEQEGMHAQKLGELLNKYKN